MQVNTHTNNRKKRGSVILAATLLFFTLTAIRPINAQDGGDYKTEEKPSLFLYFSGGIDLSPPGGSYIKHEKLYDKTLNLMIRNKQLMYSEPFSSLPVMEKSTHYQGGGFLKIGFEKVISRYAGIGSSISGTGLNSTRHKVVIDPRDANLYLLFSDSRSELQLSLAAITLDTYLHFLEADSFKPFFALHGGPAFVSGNSHPGYSTAQEQQSEKIHNGRGIAYGASVGANIFLFEEFGFRPEFVYMRYDFSADEFSSRSYYTNFINIGFFAYF